MHNIMVINIDIVDIIMLTVIKFMGHARQT